MVLDFDNILYTWGDGTSQMLGRGNTTSLTVPTSVSRIPQAVKLKSAPSYKDATYPYTFGNFAFLDINNNIRASGFNVPAKRNWPGWVYLPSPYTQSIATSFNNCSTPSFSAIKLSIPKSDPIIDFIILHGPWAPDYDGTVSIYDWYVPYTGPSIYLALTQSGHVYGIGSYMGNILGSDKPLGSGALII